MRKIVILLITLLFLLTGCKNTPFEPNVKLSKDTYERNEDLDLTKVLVDVDNVGLTFKVAEGSVNTTKPGVYQVTFTISKKSQSTQRTYTFYVKDEDAPVINCDSIIEIKYGSSFILKNYVTATDAIDGDVNDSIRFTGAIDVWTVGSYPITILAYDRYNNEGSKAVTVKVVKDVTDSYKSLIYGVYKDMTITSGTIPTLTLNPNNTFKIILSTGSMANAYSGWYIQYEDMIYLYSEYFDFGSRTEENVIKLFVEIDGSLRFDSYIPTLFAPCMGDSFVKTGDVVEEPVEDAGNTEATPE